jgi:Spy/CpxP family protein refolding chaperone
MKRLILASALALVAGLVVAQPTPGTPGPGGRGPGSGMGPGMMGGPGPRHVAA